MSKIILLAIIISSAIAIESCSKMTFPTNGETIYRTGKNLSGQALLDKSKSHLSNIARAVREKTETEMMIALLVVRI